MTEYQPRTAERLIEILKAQSPGARSWQTEAAAEIVNLRNALNEVTTNGRWTEGEQRGEWAISNEVYETARDALSPSPTGRETT